MKNANPVLVKSLVFIALLTGCATAPRTTRDPALLERQICGVGDGHREVKGSIWAKIDSAKVSGQFPASVLATGTDRFEMEITNLLGAPEATVKRKGEKLTVKAPGKQLNKASVDPIVRGISLDWMQKLLMGQIPCPPAARSKISLTGEDGLLLVYSAPGIHERYQVRYRSWGGKAWAEHMEIERNLEGAPVSRFVFDFQDPEEPSGSPKNWAVAFDQGALKVRWKDREVAR